VLAGSGGVDARLHGREGGISLAAVDLQDGGGVSVDDGAEHLVDRHQVAAMVGQHRDGPSAVDRRSVMSDRSERRHEIGCGDVESAPDPRAGFKAIFSFQGILGDQGVFGRHVVIRKPACGRRLPRVGGAPLSRPHGEATHDEQDEDEADTGPLAAACKPVVGVNVRRGAAAVAEPSLGLHSHPLERPGSRSSAAAKGIDTRE